MEYFTFFWKALLIIAIVAAAIVIGFAIFSMLSPTYKRKNFSVYRGQLITLFIIIVLPILLYEFIIINVIAHGIFLVLIGFIFWQYILDFISGIKFKLNKRINSGDVIAIDNKELGSIVKLNTFGMVLKDAKQTNLINYASLRNKTIQVLQQDINAEYINIDIEGNISLQQLESLLFKSPYIDILKKSKVQQIDETTFNVRSYLVDYSTVSNVINYLENNGLTIKA